MECDQQAVQHALHTMWDQLTTIRGNAQLLIRRLDRELGDRECDKIVCQTVIEQTRLVEAALARLIATSPELLRPTATPAAKYQFYSPDESRPRSGPQA